MPIDEKPRGGTPRPHLRVAAVKAHERTVQRVLDRMEEVIRLRRDPRLASKGSVRRFVVGDVGISSATYGRYREEWTWEWLESQLPEHVRARLAELRSSEGNPGQPFMAMVSRSMPVTAASPDARARDLRFLRAWMADAAVAAPLEFLGAAHLGLELTEVVEFRFHSSDDVQWDKDSTTLRFPVPKEVEYPVLRYLQWSWEEVELHLRTDPDVTSIHRVVGDAVALVSRSVTSALGLELNQYLQLDSPEVSACKQALADLALGLLHADAFHALVLPDPRTVLDTVGLASVLLDLERVPIAVASGFLRGHEARRHAIPEPSRDAADAAVCRSLSTYLDERRAFLLPVEAEAVLSTCWMLSLTYSFAKSLREASELREVVDRILTEGSLPTERPASTKPFSPRPEYAVGCRMASKPRTRDEGLAALWRLIDRDLSRLVDAPASAADGMRAAFKNPGAWVATGLRRVPPEALDVFCRHALEDPTWQWSARQLLAVLDVFRDTQTWAGLMNHDRRVLDRLRWERRELLPTSVDATFARLVQDVEGLNRAMSQGALMRDDDVRSVEDLVKVLRVVRKQVRDAKRVAKSSGEPPSIWIMEPPSTATAAPSVGDQGNARVRPR